MHNRGFLKAALVAAGLVSAASVNAQITKVQHVVVIYMENHSFDNLWGQFPGADGLADAKKEKIPQRDATGNPYVTLPPIQRASAFPTNLPNDVFNIDQYVAADQVSPDVLH